MIKNIVNPYEFLSKEITMDAYIFWVKYDNFIQIKFLCKLWLQFAKK